MARGRPIPYHCSQKPKASLVLSKEEERGNQLLGRNLPWTP